MAKSLLASDKVSTSAVGPVDTFLNGHQGRAKRVYTLKTQIQVRLRTAGRSQSADEHTQPKTLCQTALLASNSALIVFDGDGLCPERVVSSHLDCRLNLAFHISFYCLEPVSCLGTRLRVVYFPCRNSVASISACRYFQSSLTLSATLAVAKTHGYRT